MSDHSIQAYDTQGPTNQRLLMLLFCIATPLRFAAQPSQQKRLLPPTPTPGAHLFSSRVQCVPWGGVGAATRLAAWLHYS